MVVIKLLILAFTVIAVLGVIVLVRWLNSKVAVLEAKENQERVRESDGVSDAEKADFNVVDDE